jgi:hypothetical protein
MLIEALPQRRAARPEVGHGDGRVRREPHPRAAAERASAARLSHTQPRRDHRAPRSHALRLGRAVPAFLAAAFRTFVLYPLLVLVFEFFVRGELRAIRCT